VDALSDALFAAGALAVDVGDADAGTLAERAAFGEPGATTEPWQRSVVSALFEAGEEAFAKVVGACAQAGIPCTDGPRIEQVGDQDWVRLTQSQFKPLQIGERFWIVPSWESAPDPAAINLVLDPGAAFGTGSHPTTRLCLQWLIEHLRGGEVVLDYGCGSGILAIAAMKLGASRALGIDIDPQAVLAARANAMQNRIAAEFRDPDRSDDTRFDVVLANILANPLIVLAPLLARVTRAGGRIVLSGVLDTQAEEVAEAYAPWFEVSTARVVEGWALITGSRHG